MPVLLHDAVGSTDVERSVQEILAEWLKAWFDGDSHQVNGLAQVFPDLTNKLLFNHTEIEHGTSPLIHWTFSDLRARRWYDKDSHLRYHVALTSSVYVRVSAGGVGQKADFECRRCADLLRQILSSSERGDIAGLGLRTFRVARGPVPVPTAGYRTRMLVVTGRVEYRVATDYSLLPGEGNRPPSTSIPMADPLEGDELVAVLQDGVVKRTTAKEIADLVKPEVLELNEE